MKGIINLRNFSIHKLTNLSTKVILKGLIFSLKLKKLRTLRRSIYLYLKGHIFFVQIYFWHEIPVKLVLNYDRY